MIKNGDKDKLQQAAHKIEDDQFREELYSYLRMNHKIDLTKSSGDSSGASTIDESIVQ